MAAKSTQENIQENIQDVNASVPVFDFVNGVCSQCGDHARTDLQGHIFCPEFNADCPRHNKEDRQ